MRIKPEPSAARRGVLTAMAALALSLHGPAVHAQGWPTRTIRVLTPNSAGSQVDNIARRLGERLAAPLGQALVIENQPGAGGVIGTENLVRAPRDGHTLSVIANNHVIFPHLYRNLKFDALKDITPIAMIGASDLVLVTRAGHPARDLPELLAQARKEPGRLALGHSGNGTILHLAGEQMLRSANVRMLVVPYRGVAAVLPDVVSGQVDVGFFGPASVLALLREGRLRALGMSGPRRSALLPDVPTIAEAGVAGFEMEGWIALIGPAGLPQEIVDRLADEVGKLGADPAFQALLGGTGLAVRPMRGEALRNYFADEYARYGKLVEAAAIKAE